MVGKPRNYLLSFCALAIGFHSSLNGSCQPSWPQAEEPTIPVVLLKTVAQNPEHYLKKTVRLTGQLENQGTNYFTDLRVVLKDEEGNYLHVRPWLPTAVPPPAPGSTGERPPLLSDYLGKKVGLTAVLDRGTVKKAGEVYLLEVKSAEVVE